MLMAPKRWTPLAIQIKFEGFKGSRDYAWEFPESFPYAYNHKHGYLEIFPGGTIEPNFRDATSRAQAFQRAAAMESVIIVTIYTRKGLNQSYLIQEPEKLVA